MQELSKETKRLINELEKDLNVLRIKAEQEGNPKLLKKYRDLLVTLS